MSSTWHESMPKCPLGTNYVINFAWIFSKMSEALGTNNVIKFAWISSWLDKYAFTNALENRWLINYFSHLSLISPRCTNCTVYILCFLNLNCNLVSIKHVTDNLFCTCQGISRFHPFRAHFCNYQYKGNDIDWLLSLFDMLRCSSV